MILLLPFKVTETVGKYDVHANVKGGGLLVKLKLLD